MEPAGSSTPAPQGDPVQEIAAKKRSLRIVLLGFSLLDLPMTLLSLAFFHSGFYFDVVPIANLFTFKDGYDFMTNPFDFFALFLVRFAVVVGVCSLATFRRKGLKLIKRLSLPIVCVNLACYSLTLVKLLALAEEPTHMSFPGLWMSVAWGVLTAFVLPTLCSSLAATSKASNDYQRLDDADDSESDCDDADVEARANRSTDSADGDEKKDEDRPPMWTHIKRLLAYSAHQWPWFATGFVFLLINMLASVFEPMYTGKVIGDIVNMRGWSELVRTVLIMAGLQITDTVFGGLRGGCLNYASALVSRQVRADLFDSFVKQEIGFYDINNTGELVSRLTSDCQAVASAVASSLDNALHTFVMLFGTLGFTFFLSWRLATMNFIIFPFLMVITTYFGEYYEKIWEQTQTATANSNQKAEEVLSTMRTVRSFACERMESSRFRSKLNEMLSIERKGAIAEVIIMWIYAFSAGVVTICLFLYGGHLVLSKKMTSEQLVTFFFYQYQLEYNLYSISNVITTLLTSVGASRKVFEYMNREPLVSMDGELKPPVKGDIRLEAVSFTYPSRTKSQVLKELSLHIKAGETVALVGPSGGGKSSIVSLIEHFYEPEAGQIVLDDVPVQTIDHHYYHQKIALVAQEPVLYNASIRDNILYGCDWATEEDMIRAAKTANAHEFVDKLEKRYDTKCGEKGVQMSGGQKQRIAIARALVRNPAVLILDEATSALDAESEALVQQAFNECAKERTVLIIAHRLSTVKMADRIVVIDKGAVAQSGHHSELMKDPQGLYYSLVSKQILSAQEEVDVKLEVVQEDES